MLTIVWSNPGGDPPAIVEALGMRQVTDRSVIENVVDNARVMAKVMNERGFRVVAGHTYAEEGIYNAVINWKNSDGGAQQTPFDVEVTDAALSSTPSAINATAGVPFKGAAATFTDADPAGTVADYSATISWGDGTRSAGSIAINPSAGFVVTGTHKYMEGGTYVVKTTITDRGSWTVASSTATIADPPPSSVCATHLQKDLATQTN